MDIYNIIDYYEKSNKNIESNTYKIHYEEVSNVTKIFKKFMLLFDEKYNEKLECV